MRTSRPLSPDSGQSTPNLPDAPSHRKKAAEKFVFFPTQPDDFLLDPDWIEKMEQ